MTREYAISQLERLVEVPPGTLHGPEELAAACPAGIR